MGTDKKIRVIRDIRGQKSPPQFSVTLPRQTCAAGRTLSGEQRFGGPLLSGSE
jgi:hypothetical protein